MLPSTLLTLSSSLSPWSLAPSRRACCVSVTLSVCIYRTSTSVQSRRWFTNGDLVPKYGAEEQTPTRDGYRASEMVRTAYDRTVRKQTCLIRKPSLKLPPRNHVGRYHMNPRCTCDAAFVMPYHVGCRVFTGAISHPVANGAASCPSMYCRREFEDDPVTPMKSEIIQAGDLHLCPVVCNRMCVRDRLCTGMRPYSHWSKGVNMTTVAIPQPSLYSYSSRLTFRGE